MQITQERSSRKVKPAVLDIFCGAGGMSLGFKNAGCQILGGIDQNRYAIDTHHRNFPTARLKLAPQDIRDLRKLEQLGLNPGEVDILVGGPPCQGHLEKYKFSWEWLRDFSGFRLFRFAIWQLIEVPSSFLTGWHWKNEETGQRYRIRP